VFDLQASRSLALDQPLTGRVLDRTGVAGGGNAFDAVPLEGLAEDVGDLGTDDHGVGRSWLQLGL
jgi:hypothetical protein